MSEQESWVTRADRALAGQAADEDIEVIRGDRPPLLDAEGVRALVAPFIAAVVWGAAIFREMIAGTTVDPLAVGLRILALAFTLRVIVLGLRLIERTKVWASARRHALALAPEGLVYRTPRLDVAVPRESVVGIAAAGQWQERAAGGRSADVYVIVDPALGRTHLAIPPVLGASPVRLAERLVRWRGPIDAPPEPFEHPPSHAAAGRVYEDAAAGRAVEGTTVVRHGRGWIRKGPYLAVLAALAVADGLLRGGPAVWQAIDPWVGGGLVVGILAIFGRWFWMERRDVAPQKGLSLVLTPAELLIRQRSGILRTRWSDVVRASPTGKRSWSVLEGAHDARQLVISRRGAGPIRYDEPYLGVPVEVAQSLIDAYRSGLLPAARPTSAVAEVAAETEAP